MKNKKLVIAVIAFAAIVAVLAGVYFGTRQDPNAGKKAYTITVVHSDGSEKVFEGYSEAEYLGTVLVESGAVEDNQDQYGLYILVADGEEASWEKDQAYWGFFVNGEYAIEGMNTTETVAGAVYRLEYTIG
jgi:hypothetical protein